MLLLLMNYCKIKQAKLQKESTLQLIAKVVFIMISIGRFVFSDIASLKRDLR